MWEYRVVRKKNYYGFHNEYNYIYSIYEVYSSKNKPNHSCTEKPMYPYAEIDKGDYNSQGKAELMKDLTKMMRAFEKPVLEIIIDESGREKLIEVEE